jgi:hypothetical protein
MEKNMKINLVSLAMTIILGLGGCASMQAPTSEVLAAVPMVEFGNAAPKNSDFILYFPAGKPIPMTTSIKGSALSEEAETTQTVKLKQDIYAYKEWVSFDGKHWQPSEDALTINADMMIPSVQHPEPGLVKIQVDLK